MFKMNWIPDLTIAAACLIFLATYAVVALGKIPVYRIDRAGAALLGGSLMVATGVLSQDEAYRAVDFNTVALLLGMMIVVANLRLSGFFRVITHWIARYVRRPLTLLPQQESRPSTSRAQVCVGEAAIWATPSINAETGRGTAAVEPVPRRPDGFGPQTATPPLARTA